MTREQFRLKALKEAQLRFHPLAVEVDVYLLPEPPAKWALVTMPVKADRKRAGNVFSMVGVVKRNDR